MRTFLKNAEFTVYKFLKGGENQRELRDVIEYVISAVICLNVLLIIFESVELNSRFGFVLSVLRTCFFLFFFVEYFLRVWIADIVFNDFDHPIKVRIRYMLTFGAIIDLLALFPVLLGGTIIDFRIFRVLRLLRITRIKSLKRYTDTLLKVIKLKGFQLLASMFIIFTLMLTCAVIIYDFENPAQPQVFSNILSCLWWSMSAVTTVGYGDMFPITPMGKILGSFMSVLGVFLMSLPVGILTSGFFELSNTSDPE